MSKSFNKTCLVYQVFEDYVFTKPCHNAPLLAAGMDGIKCS
jgi:hypothetical protein